MSHEEREVCFLIGAAEAVLWSDASTSPVALPDSRARWQAIWSRREQIVEIAHTHPLGGAHFSSIDETTMTALDSGLGRRLIYSVVTPDQMLRRRPREDGADDALVADEPWWSELIRVASRIRERPAPEDDPDHRGPRTGEST
jgi:hypothetical protein